MSTCLVSQLLGPFDSLDVQRVHSAGDLGHILLALGFVDQLKIEEKKKLLSTIMFLTENKQCICFTSCDENVLRGKISHVAHVGLELSHTFVLGGVQDHREVGQVLLGVHWIVHLLTRGKKSKQTIEMVIIVLDQPESALKMKLCKKIFHQISKGNTYP